MCYSIIIIILEHQRLNNREDYNCVLPRLFIEAKKFKLKEKSIILFTKTRTNYKSFYYKMQHAIILFNLIMKERKAIKCKTNLY